MKKSVSERNSNIELLRIICMLMIISGHIVMKHQSSHQLDSFDEVFGLFWRGACSVAVNAFVLITGYFGIRFRKERLIQLDMQTVFYSVALFVLAVALGWHQVNLHEDFLFLFPLLSKKYWFVTCYAVLYLIAPLLNRWCESMNKTEFRRILVGGFLVVYGWATASFLVNAPQFINDSGYGIINFCYLYLLGYYLRHHYEKRRSSLAYWGGYLSAATLLFVSQYSLSRILGFEFTSWISYNTVFILVGAVCLFLAFEQTVFASSIVNTFAKPCLAVYLIHLHPCIWDSFCSMIGVPAYHGWKYVALLILLPIAVYLVCSLAEMLRKFCSLKIFA